MFHFSTNGVSDVSPKISQNKTRLTFAYTLWSTVWDTVGISSETLQGTDVRLHHLRFRSLMLLIVHIFCFPCFSHEWKSAHFLKASLKLELLKCGSFRRLITVSGRWILLHLLLCPHAHFTILLFWRWRYSLGYGNCIVLITKPWT